MKQGQNFCTIRYTYKNSTNQETEILRETNRSGESNITLWFLSSVSTSVEISVLGLASAMVDSSQFSVLPETRFEVWPFWYFNLWDSTETADCDCFQNKQTKIQSKCAQKNQKQPQFRSFTNLKKGNSEKTNRNFHLPYNKCLYGED